MGGVDEALKLPGVLNITVMAHEGDTVEDTNALERICLRIHVVGKDKRDFAENIVRVCDTLDIRSTTGEDMLLEPMTVERCMEAIQNTVG